MTDDKTILIELLRCPEVVGLGVDKVTRFKVLDLQLDCERLVRFDLAQVGGSEEFNRWHLGAGWDLTHGVLVTRSLPLLLTIGNLHTGRLAVADKVVCRGERRNLTGICLCLTVIEAIFANDIGIKC